MNGTLSLAFRLARRELRGGLRGFIIFLACLMLGVAAIATVQSLASGVLDGLRDDGRVILGGDAGVRQLYQDISPDQRAFLDEWGDVSRFADMRAMARADGPGNATLVELKAVERAYPLYGAVQLAEGEDLHAALAERDGTFGAVLEESVLARLGLEVGESLRIGDITLEVRDVLVSEPDRASAGGFSIGPRAMINFDALNQAGLNRPGAMIYWNYLIRMDDGRSVDAFRSEIRETYSGASWRVRDYRNAAPALERFIERLTLFLTLVGLTALLVGGVGVGNAVRSYLAGKVGTIATFKCVGAPGKLIFQIYLIQVMILALIGIGAGLVVGALAPLVLSSVVEPYLPVPIKLDFYPGGLVIAALFGLFTALSFSLLPIGRAREVPAASLFRDLIAPVAGSIRARYWIATGIAAAGLAVLAVATAPERTFAVYFVVGAILTLITFRLAAALVVWLASRMQSPRSPGLRLAIANLHRPGAATTSVVVSLGLGLTVLVTIALIEGNFSRQVQERLPENAPSFFFVDIQPDQLEPFLAQMGTMPGVSNVQHVPSLRGRIVEVNGRPAEDAIVSDENSWLLRGDRGVTYASRMPEQTRVVEGEWWPTDYQGPPLLSVYEDIAEAFDIGPGDEMTINLLGRDITAEIANVRRIQWDTLNINFTLMFAPGTLEAAPQTHIATLMATPSAEPVVQRHVAENFSNVTIVRVRDALDAVNELLSNIAMAVRYIAAVTLVAGTLVLAGAIAAGHKRRVYDSVVLKVLGARRSMILRAFSIEYGLLGVLTAVISAIIGTITAWAVLTQVMALDDWIFIPGAVISVVILCTAITLGFGFLGTWRALGQKAAPLLRND